MQEKLFKGVAIQKTDAKWEASVKRENDIDYRKEDIRTEFERDYNRILHSKAYRRLKNKTQVFFATRNDNICTRIEHVNHVSSVSYTISKFLGLNTQLTMAIAIGHDLGHAPFGHSGERIIKSIVDKVLNDNFWHEKNSLRVIDSIETLEDSTGKHKNLNLTYAVRDGIVSHCGEVNENALVPRNEVIDLHTIKKPNEYAPFTWEGCVVKIADKISYLGRDIEDALTLNILNRDQLSALKDIAGENYKAINNTILMHDFIIDLCKSSHPDIGICFSENYLRLINDVKKFNYQNIYNHKRLKNYEKYAKLVIESIYEALCGFYDGPSTIEKISSYQRSFPILCTAFIQWLEKYDKNSRSEKLLLLENKTLYDLNIENDYNKAIIDFIASITDNFAIEIFNELSSF
ncbi:MAG: HD domain-containing protein [Bacteroidales bacterium]|nr:HD domain-containing protein [Bacteroidales bacterium]